MMVETNLELVALASVGIVGSPSDCVALAVSSILHLDGVLILAMRRLFEPESLPMFLISLLLLSSSTLAKSLSSNTSLAQQPLSNYQLSSSLIPKDKCPPCFNCLLPAFTCGQYGDCDPYNGQCQCPPGWGGIDCLVPQCDSLADGSERRLREDGKECECKDGWGGINCNGMHSAMYPHSILNVCPVCRTNNACVGFPLAGAVPGEDDNKIDAANMTCYKGGETVFNNHQMCDVTSELQFHVLPLHKYQYYYLDRKILDMLPGRPPQVTFSCDTQDETCDFQFWVAQVESFYCHLDTCKSNTKVDYDTNTTTYACDTIQCSCVPGRFLCGEDGSIGTRLSFKVSDLPDRYSYRPGRLLERRN